METNKINATGKRVSEILEEYGCTLDELCNANFLKFTETYLMYFKAPSLDAFSPYDIYLFPDSNSKNKVFEYKKTGDYWTIEILYAEIGSSGGKTTKTVYVPTIAKLSESNVKKARGYSDNVFVNGLYEIEFNYYSEPVSWDTLSTSFYARVTFKKKLEPVPLLVSTFLRDYNSMNLPIGRFAARDIFTDKKGNIYLPHNVEIEVPVKQSGDIETVNSNVNTVDTTSAASRLLSSQRVFTWKSSGIRQARTSRVPTVISKYVSTSYFILFGRNNDAIAAMYLPVFPQEFTDSNTANFSPTTILGRSVQYQTYNHSSRTFNFSLKLHEELCDDYNYIHRLAAVLQSACYPNYAQNGSVDPVEILLVIGAQVKIRGILNSTNENWSSPIIDDKLVSCTIGLSITETTGPYSQSSVAYAGSIRGEDTLTDVFSNRVNTPSRAILGVNENMERNAFTVRE